MKEHSILKNIATIFLEEEIDYSSLTKGISNYKTLLAELSSIDLEDDEARSNISFENGKALGTTWAAKCIDDLIRTKRFIKGINTAIQSLQKKKKDPIHILYAGTGPYAALILPLLCLFSEKEIQLSLLEINKASFDNMLKVMAALDFTKFIHTAEQADASVYKIKDPSIIDIMVTETMQHGLVKEQQVPITINLMHQLGSEVILIPQNISLELALLNSGKLTENHLNNTNVDFYKVIGRLFELNTESARKFIKESGEKFIFPETRFDLTKEELEDFDKLVILTNIHVFDDNYITINKSGLTIPLFIDNITHRKQNGFSIRLLYVIDAEPGLQFEIINNPAKVDTKR